MEKIKTGYKVIFGVVFATIFLALSLGLYAILNHQGGMGATVNFTATGVSGTITGEVKAYNSTKFDINKSDAYDSTLIEQSTYSATFSPRTHSMADWNVGLIRFLPNDINYTGIVGLDLTITNTGTKPILLTFPSPTLEASNVAMQYAFEDKTTATTIDKTIQFAGLGIDNFSIAANTSFDISLQLYIPDRKAFASSTDIQININLTEDVSTNKAVTYANSSADDRVLIENSALPQKAVAGEDLTMVLDFTLGNSFEGVSVNGTELTEDQYTWTSSTKTLTILSTAVTTASQIAFKTQGFGNADAVANGTETTFKLSTVDDMWLFADLVNYQSTSYSDQNFKLTEDVDLNPNTTFTFNSTTNSVTIGGTDTSPTQWTPIEEFSGNFNGGGKTIGGLFMNNNSSIQALFGSITSTAVVENVVLADSYISSTVPNSSGVVALNYGVVKKCVNKSTVIVLSNSGVEGTTRSEYLGGIVGLNCGIIESCTNWGIVVSDGKYIGGVCGQNGTLIINCMNFGNVKLINASVHSAGGIAGGSFGANAYINNCINYGFIQSMNSTGGILGHGSVETSTGYSPSRVNNVLNIGLVEITYRNNRCGGIMGRCNHYGLTYIENAYYLKNSAYYLSSSNKTYLLGIGHSDATYDNIQTCFTISMEETELKSQDFIDVLNNNIAQMENVIWQSGDFTSYKTDLKLWELGEDGWPTLSDSYYSY